MALILLTMPRMARVGCADKLPQMLDNDPHLLKSHSCQQRHGWQVQAESHREIWMGLLGVGWGGFLSSLSLCFLSTEYPDLCSIGECLIFTPYGLAPVTWILSCNARPLVATDRLGDV